jgi:hypothetical protein
MRGVVTSWDNMWRRLELAREERRMARKFARDVVWFLWRFVRNAPKER